MGIKDWLFGGTAGKIVEGAEHVILRKENSEKDERGFVERQTQQQTSIEIEEARGNFLQRSWRPLAALSLIFIMIQVKFTFPLLNIHYQNYGLEQYIKAFEGDMEFWGFAKTFVCGYGLLRSGERLLQILKTK